MKQYSFGKGVIQLEDNSGWGDGIGYGDGEGYGYGYGDGYGSIYNHGSMFNHYLFGGKNIEMEKK